MTGTKHSCKPHGQSSEDINPTVKEDLIRSLESVRNAKRSYRERSRDFVLRNPGLFPQLLQMVFDTKNKLHIRAAWVAELVCLENIELLTSEVHRFTENLSLVKEESALRPVSKMVYLLSKAYFQPQDKAWALEPSEVDQLVSNSFDWLIEEHKVATHVFAMQTLFLWCGERPWIQNELRLILEQNTGKSSMAYRAAARKILEKI